MKLLDLITGPWAILPEQLFEMQRIYAVHLRGEKIDVDAIEARLGRPLANEQQTYSMRDGGVAVLPIEGVLAPKANLFMRVSGGVSTQMLMQQVESMRADPRVRSAVLAIDSPGGSVFGIPALSESIRALAAEKPTVTVSQGRMLSAAYWIGSAANAVFMEGTTDHAGSIGVVATHVFEPKRDGSITTEITAGRYKRIATGEAPLSPEGQAYLQQQVDHLYKVFVDAVAAHRGVSADDVLERMADGRVLIGQQAIDAGLVDGVSTVDDMVEKLATNPAAYARRRKAVFALGEPVSPVAADAGDAPAHDEPQPDPKGTPVMPQADNAPQVTRESLERDHAALFVQVRDEFVAQGRAQETQRVRDVLAEGEGMPSHSKLVLQMAVDGETTGPMAAQRILAAERGAIAAAGERHAADAPKPADHSAAPASDTPKSRAEIAAEAKAYAAKHNVDFVDACKALGVEA